MDHQEASARSPSITPRVVAKTLRAMNDDLTELMERVRALGTRTDALESSVAKRIADEMSARQRDVADIRSWLGAVDARIEGHEAAAAQRDAEAKVQQLMEAACSDLQDRVQKEVNAATSSAVDGIIAQLKGPRALPARTSGASGECQETPPEEVPGDVSCRVAVSNVMETYEVLRPLCELIFALEGKVEGLTAASNQARADAKLSTSFQKLDFSKMRNDQTSVLNSIQLLETSSQDMFDKICELQHGLADEARIRHDKDREIVDKLGHGLTHLLQRLDTGAFSSEGTFGFHGRGESQTTTRSMDSQGQEIGSLAGDAGTPDAKDAGRRSGDTSFTSQTASPVHATSPPPVVATSYQALMDGSRTLPPQPRPPAVVYNGSINRLSSRGSDLRQLTPLASSPLLLARNSLGSAQVPIFAARGETARPSRASSNGPVVSVVQSPPGSPLVGQTVVTLAKDSRSISPTATTTAVRIHSATCSRSLSPTARAVVQGAIVPPLNMHQSAFRSARVPSLASPSKPSVLQATQALMQQTSSRLSGPLRKTARQSTPSTVAIPE